MKRVLRLLVALALLAGEPAIAAPTPHLPGIESPLRTLCDLLYRMGQEIDLMTPGPAR